MNELADTIRTAIAEALGHQDARDDEARGMARDALQAIQSHERVCMERADAAKTHREGVQSSIAELKASTDRGIDRINRMIQSMLFSFIGTLVIVLGAMLWQKFFG